jgi:hypothetical protein
VVLGTRRTRTSISMKAMQRNCAGLSGLSRVGARRVTIPNKGWCKQWACVTDLVAGGGDLGGTGGPYFVVSEDLHAMTKEAAERELGGVGGGGGGGGNSIADVTDDLISGDAVEKKGGRRPL